LARHIRLPPRWRCGRLCAGIAQSNRCSRWRVWSSRSCAGLSYRDVEELLAERDVTVDHVTIYRWVQRFTPEFVEAARTCRHVPGDRWFVDETYVKVNGWWTYLYRAVDQHGQIIDVRLSARRDLTALLH